MTDLNKNARFRRRLFAAASIAILSTAATRAQTPQPPSFAKASDDGQWTMPAKDVASTRYSSLDEINAQNVKNLKVAFTFSTGV